MGAWGVGTLENDTAIDLIVAAGEPDGASVVTAAISAVARTPKTAALDAPSAEAALAGAELVALAGNVPGHDLPREANEWLEMHGAGVNDEVIQDAQNAVDRILDGPSELRSLWLDSGGDGREWLAEVQGLAERLSHATLTPRHGRASSVRQPAHSDETLLRPGEIFEIATNRGLAYAQFVEFDERYYCSVIRVLPGLFDRRPSQLSSIVRGPEQFFVYVRLFDDDDSRTWPVLPGTLPAASREGRRFAMRGGIVSVATLRELIERAALR